MSLKGDLHQEPSVKICASVKAVTMHQPWLTTALMEWNALHTVLTLGGWRALSLSQNGEAEYYSLPWGYHYSILDIVGQ